MEDTFHIRTLPGYLLIGLKWEGPYTQVNELKHTIKNMHKRSTELKDIIDSQKKLGLSYHTRPDGFVHYSGFQVKENTEIPLGMIDIYIPELTYLITLHQAGDDIGKTYMKIYHWLKDCAYIPYTEPNIEYYDDLPIKHEVYPVHQDLDQPHFNIMIPITRQID